MVQAKHPDELNVRARSHEAEVQVGIDVFAYSTSGSSSHPFCARSRRQDGQGTVDEIANKEDMRSALEERERKHVKSKGINFEGASLCIMGLHGDGCFSPVP